MEGEEKMRGEEGRGGRRGWSGVETGGKRSDSGLCLSPLARNYSSGFGFDCMAGMVA